MEHDRHGAKQPHRFDPARAHVLDDAERFSYVPPVELIALLDLTPRAMVVDFGTGTATYAVEIARARPDVRVFALDEQDSMLAKARAKIGEAGLQNIEGIDPPAARALQGTVDRVLALNVLHELGDDALRDIGALLAPHGRALFVDWNADADRPVGPPADHVYSADEARARLSRAGFSVASEHRSFPYHYTLVASAECAPPHSALERPPPHPA